MARPLPRRRPRPARVRPEGDERTRAYRLANAVSYFLNPLVSVVLAVLFHSVNGIKITLIDFFPNLAAHIKAVGRTSMAVFVISALAVTAIMGKQILDLL